MLFLYYRSFVYNIPANTRRWIMVGSWSRRRIDVGIQTSIRRYKLTFSRRCIEVATNPDVVWMSEFRSLSDVIN